MKRYILKRELNGQTVHDGIFPGLGIIRHGEPYAPSYPAQEAQVSEDPRFEEHQEAQDDTLDSKPTKGKGGSK